MIEALSVVPEAGIDCDVLIVGAGAAGITLASLLDDGHRTIVLAEGGGMTVDATAQSLFESVRQLGTPFAASEGRYRVFGGTTVAWTGRCAELDPIDFSERPWMPGSGWPIAQSELAGFYPQAMRLCGFADGWERVPDDGPAGDLPADLERFTWRFWHLGGGNYQDFGARFAAQFRRSARLRVLLGANLTQVDTTGERTSASLRTVEGVTRKVRARQVVLCCGGIENARLLLNLAESDSNLAGVAPMIGRYFMQHPRATTARFALDRQQSARLQRNFNRFRRAKGLEYETGMTISAASQAQHGLTNASAVLRYARNGWGVDGLVEGAAHPLDCVVSGTRRLRGREPLLGPCIASLVVDLEQAPNVDSRITLGPGQDTLGLRHAEIDWRVGAIERRTSQFLTAAVRNWLEARCLALPGLEPGGALEPDQMFESYHHLGATRMAASPRDGVVDADLRVHGTRGLYVCGGSVMPTGGHVNPTLTIVALAARLAQHLGRR